MIKAASFLQKICSFFLIITLFNNAVHSQTVEITANPATTTNYVFGTNAYAANESIYTEEEIGAANFTTPATSINQVAFKVATVGTNTSFDNVTIWMKEIPLVTTTFTSGTYSTSGYTQVFNGTVVAAVADWISIPLSVPFQRTASNNLQVLIERKDGVSHPGFVYACASGNNTGNNASSSRRYNSTEALSAATSLTTSAFRAQIRLEGTPPLPVSLIGFQAQHSGKINQLSWRTDQELNADKFIVERSADGHSFEGIGEVPASRNSNTVRNYTYSDIAPGNGVNYYRLNMVDLDHASRYSEVCSVRNDGSFDIVVYPNPAKTFFNLWINTDKPGSGRVEIVNGTGSTVLSKPLVLKAGSNLLPVMINVLPAGNYVVRVLTAQGVATRMVKKD
jgi:hypothetical protein